MRAPVILNLSCHSERSEESPSFVKRKGVGDARLGGKVTARCSNDSQLMSSTGRASPAFSLRLPASLTLKRRGRTNSPFVKRKGVRGMLIPSSPLDFLPARNDVVSGNDSSGLQV